MDLRAIRHLVTLARVLNYSRAAEELGISQPVLSRSIKAFEHQQGVKCFDRDRSGVRLTPAGKTFVSRAEVILQEFEDLENSLRNIAQGEMGELSFGMAPMPAQSSLLTEIISELITTAPELQITSYVRNVDSLLTLLETEKIEFFISAEAFFPEPYNLKSSFIGHFPVAPLVRAGHPLLKPPLESEQKFRLLLSAKTNEIPHIPLSLKPHILKDVGIIVEDNSVLAEVAENSDAIWMTSPFVALDSLEAGRLKAIPPARDEPPVRISVVIYSLNRRSLSPAALRLKRLVQLGIQNLWSRHENTIG